MARDREPLYVVGEVRPLTKEEFELVQTLLSVTSQKEKLHQLGSAQVQRMNDGGMGSLRFVASRSSERRFGGIISQAEFIDEDGVSVSAALYADQDGNLYELDMFKANFAPLVSIPPAESIRIVPV